MSRDRRIARLFVVALLLALPAAAAGPPRDFAPYPPAEPAWRAVVGSFEALLGRILPLTPEKARRSARRPGLAQCDNTGGADPNGTCKP
jgi:hypothetical protein